MISVIIFLQCVFQFAIAVSPVLDVPFIGISHISDTESTYTCPSGHSLTSCGMKHTANSKLIKGSWAVNMSQCVTENGDSAPSGVMAYAVCSRKMLDCTYPVSNDISGAGDDDEITVQCPSDRTMISCSAESPKASIDGSFVDSRFVNSVVSSDSLCTATNSGSAWPDGGVKAHATCCKPFEADSELNCETRWGVADYYESRVSCPVGKSILGCSADTYYDTVSGYFVDPATNECVATATGAGVYAVATCCSFDPIPTASPSKKPSDQPTFQPTTDEPTPSPTSEPTASPTFSWSYVGCYVDNSADRALRFGPHAYGYTVETCSEACISFTYFALQDGGWCSCDNAESLATKYGESTSCATNGLGGAWANALYKNGDRPWDVPFIAWGGVSGSNDDERSVSVCPAGHTMTGCGIKAHNNQNPRIDGSWKHDSVQCYAQNGWGGQGVQAVGICARREFDCLQFGSIQSGFGNDDATYAQCPSDRTMVSCSVSAAYASIDGVFIGNIYDDTEITSSTTCAAMNSGNSFPSGGGGVVAHATCCKTQVDVQNELKCETRWGPGVSAGQSRVACDYDQSMMGCSGYSAFAVLSGYWIDSASDQCVAESGGNAPVAAIATCCWFQQNEPSFVNAGANDKKATDEKYQVSGVGAMSAVFVWLPILMHLL